VAQIEPLASFQRFVAIWTIWSMAQMIQMVWLISSFEPISGFRTGSDIDDGIPLRRFLVRHAIVILAH
jgi:hypothetical protein